MLVAEQERRLAPLAMARALRRLPALLAELPLAELDERATGAEVELVPRGDRHTRLATTPTGSRATSPPASPKVTAPVQLIGGWYDIFLPWMLEDFEALQAAGHEPQLIIGPWTHTAPGTAGAGIA